MPRKKPSQLKKDIAAIQTRSAFDGASEAEKLAILVEAVNGAFEGDTAPQQLAAALTLAVDAQYAVAVAIDCQSTVDQMGRRIEELKAELNKSPADPTQAKIEGLVKVVEALVNKAAAA